MPDESVSAPGTADAALVARLLAGDEDAFRTLVEREHRVLVRVAQLYVAERAVAEEAAQETWLAVLRGLAGFEGRSSLRTWMLRILVNRARSIARREQRQERPDPAGPAVSSSRFRGADAPYPGHWAPGLAPRPWADDPETLVLRAETLAVVRDAVAKLPDRQREVVALRDIEGLTAEETCNILGLTETNQRVLLHRGRTAIRGELERYLTGGDR